MTRRHKSHTPLASNPTEMAGLPRLLDVRDDLRRADEASDRELRDETGHVLDLLSEYATDAPDGARSSSNLDEADEELLRLEEQTDSDVAGERLQAARNRIRIFRDSVAGAADGLAVVAARETTRDGDPAVEATVVNDADAATTAAVTVTAYDADGDRIETATAEADVDPGGETTVPVRVDLPDGTDRYVAGAEAADR